jgi:ferredoxin
VADDRASEGARGHCLTVNFRALSVWEIEAVPKRLLQRDRLKRRAMVSAVVVAEAVRCVECGICSYSCPMGIDVRLHARKGLPIAHQYCLTCGECVARCPRGTLRFDVATLFAAGSGSGAD